jgi:hypothetical protein
VIDTSTVRNRFTATITATYLAVVKTANITVTLPIPRAAFTVTSPSRGTNACALIEQGRELDCRLDGSGSDGVLVRWEWVLTVTDRIVARKPEPIFAEIDTGGCKFVDDATTFSDDGSEYVNMTISLEIHDRDDSSSTTSKTVRLYTNDHCDLGD